MFKKIITLLLLIFSSNCVFAVDKKELNLDFFSKFNDEYLVHYINLAIDNNHEAKQAAKRVEQYRQQVKYSFSKELPLLSVNADYLGIKIPEIDYFSLDKNAFILPFLANYEADFLLKNRDKTKSAKKSYEISQYEEKTVYISLMTDVATVYTNICQYDELIKLASQQVDTYSKILYFNTKKYNQGIINSTQLNNSKQNLKTVQNELEKLQKEQELLLMQLAVLTGFSPLDGISLERGNFNDFDYQENLPTEIASDVIFSRPDVISAEKMLEKKNIDIRVARKEFFPTFNITGIWAFNTISPGTFFSWQSSLAAIIAGASQDIFTGGRKIANLKIKKAEYEELFEKYKQTDLDAVKEVNSALCLVKYDYEIDKKTLTKLNYEYRNIQSEQQRINEGTISAPEYLRTVANFVNIQKEAVRTKTQRLINCFTLYKSLGGNL